MIVVFPDVVSVNISTVSSSGQVAESFPNNEESVVYILYIFWYRIIYLDPVSLSLNDVLSNYRRTTNFSYALISNKFILLLPGHLVPNYPKFAA